jgi:hypothetical protein
MILVTFISTHFLIICDVLLCRTYETHPTLSLKFGCDNSPVVHRTLYCSLSGECHVSRPLGFGAVDC